MFLKLGQFKRALPLNREALRGAVALRGKRDAHAMSARKNLALVLMQLGEMREAEALFREVLALRTEVLGPDHPQTLASSSDLGTLLRGVPSGGSGSAGSSGAASGVSAASLQSALAGMGLRSGPAPAAPGADKESVRLYRDKLARQRTTLGDSHEQTLSTMNNLAIVLGESSPGECEALYREVLLGRHAKLGEWHKDTTDVRYNLAMLLLRTRRKLDEATHLLFALQRHYARTLGETHADTRETRTALAKLLAAQLARCFQRRRI